MSKIHLDKVEKRPVHPRGDNAPANLPIEHQADSAASKSMSTSLAIRSSSPLVSSPETNPFGVRPSSCPTIIPPPQRKPKLSVNTSCTQRLLGRVGTGLRLEALSAVSPTVRNTFKNSYEAPAAPGTPVQALGSAFSPPAPTNSSPKPPTPHPLNDSALSPSSTESGPSTPSSSPPPDGDKVPYTLADDQASILKNTPLPRSLQRPASAGRRSRTASSPGHSPSKRVAFRQPRLTEDIHTREYIVPHFDLVLDATPVKSPTDQGGARAGSKRVSPTDEEVSEGEGESSENEAYPKTPIAGRRKRRREWVWTLAPVTGSRNEQNDDWIGSSNDG